MFEDLTTIDYEKEYHEQRELLKEAKHVIQKERARRYVLEDLSHENHRAARDMAKTLREYRDKYRKQDFDNLDELAEDYWDKEDD